MKDSQEQQAQLLLSTFCSAEAKAESPESFESSLFGNTSGSSILHMDLKMGTVYTYVCKHWLYVSPKGAYQYAG